MAITHVIKGIGHGSLFGYGRFMGVHNPFGSALEKAKDPFINLRTLARLSNHTDPEIRTSVKENLSSRINSNELGSKIVCKIDRAVLVEALMPGRSRDWLDRELELKYDIRRVDADMGRSLFHPRQPREYLKWLFHPSELPDSICKFIKSADPQELEMLAGSQGNNVRQCVADNPRTPRTMLLRLIFDESSWVGKTAYTTISDTLTGKELDEIVSKLKDPYLLTQVAENPNLRKATLFQLVFERFLGDADRKKFEFSWYSNILSNVLHALAENESDHALAKTTVGPDVFRKTLLKLATPEQAYRSAGSSYASRHGARSTRELDLDRDRENLKIADLAYDVLVKSPLTPDELTMLSRSKSSYVLSKIAHPPYTPKEK